MFLNWFLVACSAAVAASGERTVLGTQFGPYPVSMENVELKTDRTDPLAPEPTKRRIMLSVYQPQMHSFACASTTYMPWMPNRTATIMIKQSPAGIPLPDLPGLDFHDVEIQYCDRHSGPSTASQAPLLVFQPGYQEDRFQYQTILSAIASSGYTVISMDITYETPIVEFPDGSYVLNNTGISDGGLGPNDALPVRVADISSVLDALQEGKIRLPGLEEFEGTHEEVKAGVFGHSLGGAAAVLAAGLNKRVVAALNHDGQFFLDHANVSVSKPVLLFQRESPLEGHLASWEDEWDKRLLDFRAWIGVNNSQHLSFTDLPLVVEAEGLRGKGSAEVKQGMGAIAATRMGEIIWRYSTSFFDFVLKKKGLTLLESGNVEYPDVFFVKETIGG